MSRWRLFLPLLAFLGLSVLFWKGLSLDPNYMPSALANRPLPAFSARTLEGGDISDAQLRGAPALLNVWATWCPSCAAEHVYLNQLAARGVRIFGVNYKDNPEAARRWIQSKGNPYVANILDPDGRLGLDLGVTGAPETYLIDGEGVVHLRHQGPVDERVWRTVFVPALAELDSAGAGR